MKKSPRVKLKEADTQRTIIGWLTLRNILFIRNNSGAMVSEYKGKKRFMRFGSKGSPDILVFHEGKTIGVEVKGTDGVQSPEQKEFEQRFTKEGFTYILARSLDDVERHLNK